MEAVPQQYPPAPTSGRLACRRVTANETEARTREGRDRRVLGLPTGGSIHSGDLRSVGRLSPQIFDPLLAPLERPVHADQSRYIQAPISAVKPAFEHGQAVLYKDNCLHWLSEAPEESIHAVVTDPPYGLVEYTPREQGKLRAGKGGVWRIPPSFDGHQRSPLPRFTTLSAADLEYLTRFFTSWGTVLRRVLVPGAHIVVASNPLVSHLVSVSLADAGLERRGEIVRLVMTMRGGDRPKGAHEEYGGVSVMPRSMWEPWLLFRKPIEGRVQDNLRKWKTGGLRRLSDQQPFGDVVKSQPTRAAERAIAPHPSLKPQSFLRHVVRATLPLGEGVVLDPFAGSGSTLAAAEHLQYDSIGIESDENYIEVAKKAIAKLARLKV
ncbi:MAG: DNA-methyltransferase [Acidimicrobiales bacterium]